MLDTNLTGVWNTARAGVPQLISQGQGGAVLLTSSSLALNAAGNFAAYTSAKHGVVTLVGAPTPSATDPGLGVDPGD